MRLSDFFCPRWKHSDKEIRLCAVKKLDNKKKLAKIARNDPEEDIREAAVQKLENQNLLTEIANNDSSYIVRCTAAARTQNKDLLMKIIKEDTLVENGTIFNICSEAVKKMEDQTILTDIAENAKDKRIRQEAAEKLTELFWNIYCNKC